MKACKCGRAIHHRTTGMCKKCRNEYERKRWSRRAPPSQWDRMKNKARKSARYALKAEHLLKCDCEICGSAESQMHHENYLLPLVVTWLCRKCHTAVHKYQRNGEKCSLEKYIQGVIPSATEEEVARLCQRFSEYGTDYSERVFREWTHPAYHPMANLAWPLREQDQHARSSSGP
jgi:hypothetical protein